MRKKSLLARVTSLTLAGMLLLASCSGNPQSGAEPQPNSDSGKESSGAAGSEAAGSDGQNTQDKFIKYDPPITLSTHRVVDVNTLFHEGCDAENNAWTTWMKDTYGIITEMKWVAPDSTTDTQKLDLAFASDDFPDIIQANVSQVAKFASAGKLMVLDDLMEKHASPLVKWYIEDGEQNTQGALWSPYTMGGKKYAMPIISDTLYYWYANFIRDDIVAELGFELPSTLAEMEEIFAAYKQKYPDQYALTMNKDLSGLLVAMTAYEAYPSNPASSTWVEKDGKLVFGSIQPEVREGLVTLNEWYTKGYIDPEFVVKDSNKVSEDIANGKFLVHYAPWHAIGSPFTPMWNNLPESSVTPIPFLSGEGGKAGIARDTWFTQSRSLSASCEHPEAALNLFSDNLDSYLRNDTELRDLMKSEYGYEFKYPVTEVLEPINAAEVAEKYPNNQPGQLHIYEYPYELQGAGFFNEYDTVGWGNWLGFAGKPVSISNQDFASVAEMEKTGNRDVLTVGGANTYDGWQASHPNMTKTFAGIYTYWDGLMNSNDVLHPNAYAGAPTEAMMEKQAYLEKLQLETFTRVIMGTQPIEAFDEFVDNWIANGGQEITDEVNAWYSAR